MARLSAQQHVACDAAVPLHFINEASSPAGKSSEVVVTHELNEVQVVCLPGVVRRLRDLQRRGCDQVADACRDMEE